MKNIKPNMILLNRLPETSTVIKVRVIENLDRLEKDMWRVVPVGNDNGNNEQLIADNKTYGCPAKNLFRDIDTSNIEVVDVGGIDRRDYPDFCDAYIQDANWKDTNKPLTEEELEVLNESGDYNDFVYESVLKYLN